MSAEAIARLRVAATLDEAVDFGGVRVRLADLRILLDAHAAPIRREGEEDVMAAKTMKRRKVWVNFIPGDNGGEAFNKKWEANWYAGELALAVAVPFVEARPGDVVLSREDVAELKTLVGSIEWAPHAQRALALLRGGR